MLLWTAIALAGPRDDALQVVDAAQHDEYRSEFAITLPTEVELPATYRIRMEGKQIAHPEGGWRLDWIRDASGACAELLNQNGFHRVPIPTDVLDHAVHVGLFVRGGEAVRKDGSTQFGSGGTSHIAIRTVQGLVDLPDVRAANTDLRSRSSYREFADSWFVLELERLGRQHLTEETRLPTTDAVRDTWRDALGSAGAEGFAGVIGPPAYEGLLAHLLASSGEERFLQVLDAVGATDQAAGLRVSLLDDDEVVAGLVEPLCGEWQHSREALARAGQLGEEARPAYLEGLKCDLHESRIVEILGRLASLPSDPATDAAIDALLETDVHGDVRVAGLRARWRTSEDGVHLDALEAFAESGELTEPMRSAYGILVHAAADESRKRRVAGQIAARLDAMPLDAHPTYSGKDHLISLLASVGDRKQLPSIERFLNASPGTPQIEIQALLAIDRQAGLRAVLAQLERYVDGDGSYRWLVWPFFDRLVCEDLTAAAKSLTRGRSRLEGDTRTMGWSLEPHDALIGYLESSEGRAERAAAFIEAEGTRLSSTARECLVARHPDLTPERIEAADAASEEAVDAEHLPWGVPWQRSTTR